MATTTPLPSSKSHSFQPKPRANLAKEALGHTEYIPANQLSVDASYQRTDEINWTKVRNIASRPNLVLLETITVARRANGSFWIVDGQHRWLGFQQINEEYPMPCRVHQSQGVQWEADLYNQLNTHRTTPSAHGRYKSALAAGVGFGYDNEAAVRTMLDDIGITYIPTPTFQSMRHDLRPCALLAIGTVLRQHRNSPTLTNWSLGVIKDAWDPTHGDAYKVPILSGMFMFMAAHNPETEDAEHAVDMDALIGVLKATDPRTVIEEADDLRGNRQYSSGSCVARVIAINYNTRRVGRSTRLRELTPAAYTVALSSFLVTRRNLNPTEEQVKARNANLAKGAAVQRGRTSGKTAPRRKSAAA